MEVWKDISGYEGLYQISDLGNVRSLDRYVNHSRSGKRFCKGHQMATHINNAGYICVNLSKDGKYKSFDVHRLVAMVFLAVANIDGLEVNHIDENKKNNVVTNLEWVTKKQNNNYGTKIERQASKIKIPVIQYNENGGFVAEWSSAADAERTISGKVTGAISHCIKGKTKTAFGYIWKAKEAA